MHIIRLLLALSLTIGLSIVLNNRIGSIPPLGKLLDPFNGLWANAEGNRPNWDANISGAGLLETATVRYDERRVPHIFAKNNHDLYFLQGYVEAKDRLWQMDFYIRLVSGRLSEVLGNQSLDIDRYFRRLGLYQAAEASYKLNNSDPNMQEATSAYAKGVNFYVRSLHPRDYPIEFKLLDYKPQPWLPEYAYYIRALMSFDLTSYEQDIEMTNALAVWGDSVFAHLYPDFYKGISPMVPDMKISSPLDLIPMPDAPYKPATLLPALQHFLPNAANGSNNWAVHGSRTTTGSPLLANDPHLFLTLPSIWYEQQHHTPEFSCYGVSISGTPMIIVGFNERMAWGITNGTRDVKDWYAMQYDSSGLKYLFEGEYRLLIPRVETIHVRGMSTIIDTVWCTHFGPIVFDERFGLDTMKIGLALRWSALDPGGEGKALYYLNRASDTSEALQALTTWVNPGQNFALAFQNGDIGLVQTGKYPLLWEGQGRFVLDGSRSDHQWQDYIPTDQNPQHFNPERGWVSSANQHPTGQEYPYYYSGQFEYYRGVRVNELLAETDKADVAYMQQMQLDNYNAFAAHILPWFIQAADSLKLPDETSMLVNTLKDWDKVNSPHSSGAACFEALWEAFSQLCHDEQTVYKIPIARPKPYLIADLVQTEPGHTYFDLIESEHKESAFDLARMAFIAAADSIKVKEGALGKSIEWHHYKGTQLTHLLRAVDAFHIRNLEVGGNRHILNAITSTHGGSWRMVVSLEPDGPKAWGVYPGGQSGNPGSPAYGQFVQKWVAGGQYRLLFWDQSEQNEAYFTQTFSTQQ